jgi:LysR family transcriptional activator of nhaA
MKDLNYHHLRYFWVVAREGGITPASRVLGVTQPTISTQIASLEEYLGAKLFRRSGNRLELTDVGRTVQQYAADIFSLGDQLQTAVERRETGHAVRLAVGIDDALPLLSARKILMPALVMPSEDVRLILRTDKPDRLLSALSARTLDVILTDSPVSPSSPVRAHTHLVAESGLTLFAAPELAKELGDDFPAMLEGAPFIYHTENTAMRRAMDAWLTRNGVHPMVAGEVENVAFLQLLGGAGRGVFCAPTLVEDEICARYGVQVIGRTDQISEQFFAATLERNPTNPGVLRILESA